MRTLNDQGIETLREVEVGFFIEEEGASAPTCSPQPSQPAAARSTMLIV
jgi:hypothetical protein